MTDKTTLTNKILLKEAEIKVVKALLESLDSLEQSAMYSYSRIGKTTEQAKDWRTGELLWEDADKTIPMYETKWDYVPKKDPDKLLVDVISQYREKLINI